MLQQCLTKFCGANVVTKFCAGLINQPKIVLGSENYYIFLLEMMFWWKSPVKNVVAMLNTFLKSLKLGGTVFTKPPP